MGKIKDTVMYPIVAPAGDDIIIGTDKSDSDITKNFTVQSIADLVAGTSNTYTLTNIGNPSTLQLRLSDGTTNNDVTIVPGTGINLSGGTTTSSTINLDIPVTVAHGGTGLTSYTTGDLLYASGATAISTLSTSGHVGKVLQVSSGGIPEWVTFNPGAGTVTSVGPSNGTYVSSSSAAITSSGTLQFDLSATGKTGDGSTQFLRGDNTWATPVAGQIPIENAGSQITAAVSKINFTGAGVTATNSGNDVTVDVPLTSVNTSMNVGYEYSLAFIMQGDLNNVRIDDQTNLLYNAGSSANTVSLKSNNKAQMQMISYTDTNTRYPSLELFRYRGTKASPSSVLTNDIIGGITFNSGYSGNNYDDVSEIFSRATEDHTSTTTGSELVFGTTKNGSSTAVAIPEKMILRNDGNLEVQQVYSDNTNNSIGFNSSSGATATFNGNTFKTLARVTFGAGSPSAVTIDFTNVYGTFPYHLIISGGSGKTITFTLNGNSVSFPSGSGGQFTPSGTNDLIQFNFTPTAGGFNGGFATLLGSNYSI